MRSSQRQSPFLTNPDIPPIGSFLRFYLACQIWASSGLDRVFFGGWRANLLHLLQTFLNSFVLYVISYKFAKRGCGESNIDFFSAMWWIYSRRMTCVSLREKPPLRIVRRRGQPDFLHPARAMCDSSKEKMIKAQKLKGDVVKSRRPLSPLIRQANNIHLTRIGQYRRPPGRVWNVRFYGETRAKSVWIKSLSVARPTIKYFGYPASWLWGRAFINRTRAVVMRISLTVACTRFGASRTKPIIGSFSSLKMRPRVFFLPHQKDLIDIKLLSATTQRLKEVSEECDQKKNQKSEPATITEADEGCESNNNSQCVTVL